MFAVANTSLRVARRVLLAEDQPPVARVLCEALETAGYEVEIVGTGVAAMTAARARRPDVIILDVGLPGALTADAAMPWLMRLAPVIVITNRDDDELQRRLLANGAFAYLPNAFDVARLLDTVRVAVTPGGR